MSPEFVAPHGSDAGEHPAPEDLVALHGGRLEAEAAETLHEHLRKCDQCAHLAADFADLGGLQRQGRRELGKGGTAAARARLPIPRPAAAALREGVRPGTGTAAARLPWTLAAVLLVALAVTGLWGLEQRRELADREAPARAASTDSWTQLAVVPLAEGERTLRGGGEADARTVVVPPRIEMVAFALAHGGIGEGPHRVELWTEGAADSPLWAGEVLRGADGTLSFALPATVLPPGRYRFRLVPPGDGSATVYPFRLVAAPR